MLGIEARLSKAKVFALGVQTLSSEVQVSDFWGHCRLHLGEAHYVL